MSNTLDHDLSSSDPFQDFLQEHYQDPAAGPADKKLAKARRQGAAQAILLQDFIAHELMKLKKQIADEKKQQETSPDRSETLRNLAAAIKDASATRIAALSETPSSLTIKEMPVERKQDQALTPNQAIKIETLKKLIDALFQRIYDSAEAARGEELDEITIADPIALALLGIEPLPESEE